MQWVEDRQRYGRKVHLAHRDACGVDVLTYGYLMLNSIREICPRNAGEATAASVCMHVYIHTHMCIHIVMCVV